MNTTTQVPPGFRFHPTEEELVDYYLRRKVSARRIDVDIIKEIDLYKIEPWDLQELCKTGDEEQNEWYFFSHKDKKYPTGTRTNRATAAGFWKATGRDKAIYCKHDLIGMRKTLVFYKGRAPNGQKSDWIMHEYRLETDENGAPQEEGWAVCRVFKKRTPTTMRRMGGHESPCWYDDQVSLMSELDSPQQASQSSNMLNNYSSSSYPCKKEFSHHHHHHHHQLPFQLPQDHLVHLPLFENSRMLLASPHGTTNYTNASFLPYGLDMGLHSSSNAQVQQPENSNFNHNAAATILLGSNNNSDQDALDDQMTDWRVLDKFVASQLSQEDVAKGNNNNNNHDNNNSNHDNSNNNNNNYLSSGVGSGLLFPTGPISDHLNKEETLPDNASTPSSSSQIDVWK